MEAPQATTHHPHYEVITRADTLMMALLKLWHAQSKPDLKFGLTHTDR